MDEQQTHQADIGYIVSIASRRFAVWHEDKYYSGIFDGVWLDRVNFLTDGHEAKISAIVFDGQSRVFSDDEVGVVRIYSSLIVGVRSTEQSVGIIVGGFCPQHLQ